MKGHIKQSAESSRILRKKPPENSGPDTSALSGGWSAIKAELQERKEQGLADRVEIQAKIIRGDLALRSDFALALGNIYATYRSQVLVLGESTGDIIANFLGISETHNVRKIMSELAYGMMRDEKRDLEAFIKSFVKTRYRVIGRDSGLSGGLLGHFRKGLGSYPVTLFLNGTKLDGSL